MKQINFWENNTHPDEQELAPLAAGAAPVDSWLGGVHPDGFLEFSKGFYLYADKLSRLLGYLNQERQEDSAVYMQLAQVTGLSTARVEALVQYAVYMQLLVPRALRLTPLGRLALQADPFFDQPATLWLLHYLLASNPLLVVWNFMCNTVLPGLTEIDKDQAAGQFQVFSGRWSEISLEKKTPKELRAFFAAYTQEMFAPLSFLRSSGKQSYELPRQLTLTPPLTLMATLLIYRDRFQPGSSGLEIPTLAYAEHSPGRLMRQPEAYLRKALDQLHESGWLTIESKANLDQVRFKQPVTWFQAVRASYAPDQPARNETHA